MNSEQDHNEFLKYNEYMNKIKKDVDDEVENKRGKGWFELLCLKISSFGRK